MATPMTPGHDQPAPMYVHDYAAVPRPVDATVMVFTTMFADDVLADVVSRVWNAEAPVLSSMVTTHRCGPNVVRATRVRVEVGSHRLRNDAAIIAIRWRGDGWLPALDADLELVGFGATWTHLHLMGQYQLPSGVERYTATGSLLQRVMVTVVREFLTQLGELLTDAQS